MKTSSLNATFLLSVPGVFPIPERFAIDEMEGESGMESWRTGATRLAKKEAVEAEVGNFRCELRKELEERELEYVVEWESGGPCEDVGRRADRGVAMTRCCKVESAKVGKAKRRDEPD